MVLNTCNNKILMVAYEYVPCQSAGVQRTLKFTEYLPDLGWTPVVLTAKSYLYPKKDNSVGAPDGVSVHRAFGLNASTHLSYRGKYFGFTSIPDRYGSWFFHAVFKGLSLIKREKPKVIWSTFPFSSGHWVGLTLNVLTGLPWIADYRDPAAFHYYPDEYNRLAKWIDRKVVQRAAKIVFATAAMRDLYCREYSDLGIEKTIIIENGFNEEVLSEYVDKKNDTEPDGNFLILHSGAIYSNGRDPCPLLMALGELKKRSPDIASKIRIRFRAADCLPEYLSIIKKYDIGQLVEFCSAVGYIESVKEMCRADALLLIQGQVFSYQIPGKAYEYIASNKPILCLTNEKSATEKLLRGVEGVLVSGETDVMSIVAALEDCADYLTKQSGLHRDVTQYSRYTKSKQLAKLLDTVVRTSSPSS